MEYDIKAGDIVLSKMGRDAGRYFVVFRTEGIFAYLCDGDLRKTDSLKKKKFKHLKPTGESSSFAISKIESGEKLTNVEVRREIQEFCERNDIER